MNAIATSLVTLCSLALASPGPGQLTQRSAQSIELSDGTFASIRDEILPSEGETSWRKIGWRSDLRTGLQEGSDRDMPILLWAMNGHPLGCV